LLLAVIAFLVGGLCFGARLRDLGQLDRLLPEPYLGSEGARPPTTHSEWLAWQAKSRALAQDTERFTTCAGPGQARSWHVAPWRRVGSAFRRWLTFRAAERSRSLTPRGALLIGELTSAGTHPMAVSLLNQHLGDIENELAYAQGSRATGARVALATGSLLAVIGVAQGLPEPGWSPTGSVLALCFASVFALALRQLDRLADARVRRIRREWDDWAGALRPWLPPHPTTPERVQGRIT
jgi:hypothetical protein